jgi:drug/metabolite transporter (DMT)-like permease
MLAAVFTWALYTIGLQWRPAGVDPMLLLAAFTPRRPARPRPGLRLGDRAGQTIQVSPGSLAGIAYTGVFPGFLGYVFYNRAVGEVGASKASLFIHLMPVFGTLLSAIFLAEIPQRLPLPRHRPDLHRHLPDHRRCRGGEDA